MSRREIIEIGEYYHIYNRGIDRRSIVETFDDLNRFKNSLDIFNDVNPVGSIYEQGFIKTESEDFEPLVELCAYAILPNHYHLILGEIKEGGISEYMKRLGGYTWYFNHKHKRSGVLFQGKYKSVHIGKNEQLLHLSAYVNLNHKIHQLGGPTAKLVETSIGEYINGNSTEDICNPSLILGQFESGKDYLEFAKDSIQETIIKKKEGVKSESYLFE